MTGSHVSLQDSLNIPCMVLLKFMWCATYLLDNICIRFSTKLNRHVVGTPMGTNCAPLFADLILLCHKRGFIMSLSDEKQADIICF